jgi:uncharacterized protein (TIGR00255 family)
MTGFGEGAAQNSRVVATVEIRSVNNRYLKVTTKIPDSHAKLEPELERIVRDQLSRGTVSITIRIVYLAGMQSYRLNEEVIEGFLSQLRSFTNNPKEMLPAILSLPGAVVESMPDDEADLDAPLIEEALRQAIASLEEMRLREGKSMNQDLESHCQRIEEFTDRIAERFPFVSNSYRDRLADRVNELLKTHGLTLQPGDLIREVSIYADRIDIAEEMARLRSHVAQFRALMAGPEACGRKLDFLGQEMFRECNTMGAKSGDVQVSSLVVELKSVVERIREMIANVE